MSEQPSIFNRSFWDLWIQKMLRNIASVKYQFMLLFVVIIVVGMFKEGYTKGEPFISAAAGLSFLAGGFITFATARIVANTKLTEDNDFNTDK